MKVAIYTRVSGKSNRQDAANQSLQLIEYCQRQGGVTSSTRTA